MIRRFGILNDQIEPGDALLYGIPYPGVYVTDADGVVVAKSFHDTYKKRDSPELLLDAALGRVTLADDAPRATGGDPEVRVTAAIHGGRGTIRQGIRRELVVRFDIAPGLHLYGDPVPEGMLPVRVRLTGPPGLAVEEAIYPPTERLHLPSLDLELPIWSGRLDVRVPFYAKGELASEVRPLDAPSATLEVEVRYQACDDDACLLPRTEKLTIEVPLDVIDVPAVGLHMGHGQREADFDGAPHLRRLMLRKLRAHPLGFLRFVAKNVRLELAARRRARAARRADHHS